VTRFAVTALLLLAACSRGGEDTGALSGEEQRQLNDAAEMLDANSVTLEDAPDNTNSGESDQ
jgi:hypothetical protein